MQTDKPLAAALSCLPDRLRRVVERLPEDIKAETREIRLRAEKPLMLCGSYGCCFPEAGGKYSRLFPDRTPSPTREELAQIVGALAGHSVYSHTDEINAGYITFGDGMRAGVAGTAATDDGRIKSVRDLRSVNIRVARSVPGVADRLAGTLYADGLKNVVLFGAPLCGKTTMLKDFARILSSYPLYYRTAIVDERRELSGADGVNIDVFSGYPKREGIACAVRAFSPDVLICDELGTAAECEAVLKAIGCGVRFLVSVHCGGRAALLRRPICRALIDCGFFDAFVFLPQIGAAPVIMDGKELYDESRCVCDDPVVLGEPRVADSRAAVEKAVRA